MSLVNVSGASKVALSGFDPVSFFEGDKPLNGIHEITSTYQDAIYFFASEENKATFEKDQDKYVPAYGGFCAVGVSVGNLLPVDMATAGVYKGKLYINLSPRVLEMFEGDKDGFIERADKAWPGLVEKYA